MDATTIFPSKWLKAPDLGASRPVVTIESFELRKYADGDPAPTIYFRGKSKALGLNKTNLNNLILMFGKDTSNWSGKKIQLFVVQTQDPKGKATQGIRVGPVGEVAQGNSVVHHADDDLPPREFDDPIDDLHSEEAPF